jgi:hypothetical protein
MLKHIESIMSDWLINKISDLQDTKFLPLFDVHY